jgi:hypothetical protein
MKLCCFRDNGLQTCADCLKFAKCETIQSWFAKGGKYARYKKFLEYIREHGYEEFLLRADKWTYEAGRLD